MPKSEQISEAKREIHETIKLSKFCMKRIGLSFEEPNGAWAYFKEKLMFILSVCSICYHVFSEAANIGLTLVNSPRVEDVVPLFHTFGYGALSIAKVSVLWYKKDVFKQLLEEMAAIWPTPPLEEEAQATKDKMLAALRITHQWYFIINVSGVWFYNLTPIVLYFYRLSQGMSSQIGYVWVSWYPFDKAQPILHVAVYIFEIFAGQICVWIMVSTDLLFSGMASHISLLIRLLHRRLESLAYNAQTDDECYQEITASIKLHQRLITYCSDVEEAFSLVNLINIVMSSVNICCVVFVIVLLEPLLVMSSKLFLMSALIQIGMLCWYADDIYHANAEVASAAYNSGWYRTNAKCRRALLFLIKRSQKPIALTAMNFTNISLVTYSSIISKSYSYFALLYTMYKDDN